MVILEVLSPMPLTTREDGRRILDLWKTHLPHLLPDFYGNWEPIDRPFDVQRLDVVLEQWKWPFFAYRKTPRVEASLLMRKGSKQRLHSTLIFRFQPASVKQSQLVDFLIAASQDLRSDFACIHLLTPTELERGRANNTVTALDKARKKLRFFISSVDIQQRLPDLYWATVLGAPYSEMIGRDRLISAPSFVAKSLPNDSVLIQMTENLLDVELHPSAFDDIRSQVKEHLGVEAFFRPNVTAYRAPSFKFA
jgi:hypothetical protein